MRFCGESHADMCRRVLSPSLSQSVLCSLPFCPLPLLWRHLSTIGLVAHLRWSILHTVPPRMTSSINGPSYSYSAAALRRFPDVPREARDDVWMPCCEGYASVRIPSSCQSFFAREGSTGQCVTTIFWLVPDLWPAHLLVDETPVSFKDRRCAVNSPLLGAVYFSSVSDPPLGFLSGGGDNSDVAGQRRRDTLQVHG